MKKAKEQKAQKVPGKTWGRRLATWLGALIGLIILLYIFRGWVRMSVIPRAVQAVHGNQANSVSDDETKKLQDPLALLGYTSIQSQTGSCKTVLAKGLSTQVDCSYNVRAFGEIDKAAFSKDELDANAAKLQDLLKQNGWQGEYTDGGTYTSLHKLVMSLTAGIDYQPDAYYTKQVGQVTCYFDSNTAFSSPQPPAIASQISCSRTFNVLGTPQPSNPGKPD